MPTYLVGASLLWLCACGTSESPSTVTTHPTAPTAAAGGQLRAAPPPPGCVTEPTLTSEVAVIPVRSTTPLTIAIPIREPFAKAITQARQGKVWVVAYCRTQLDHDNQQQHTHRMPHQAARDRQEAKHG